MKRILTAAAMTLALALPGTVAAAATERAQSSGDISVRARPVAQHGALSTARDANGAVTMWIDVADLDATTPAGWRALTRRVELGVATICDIAQDEPRIAGYYNPGQRACWAETREQAMAQLARARRAALNGEHASRLALAGARPQR